MPRWLLALVICAPLAAGQKPALDPWTVVSLRQVTEALPLAGELGGGFLYGLSVPRGADEADGGARRELRWVRGPEEASKIFLGSEFSARLVRRHPTGRRVTLLARGPKEKVTRVWSADPRAESPAKDLVALSPEGVSVTTYALSPSGGYLAFTTRESLSSKRKAEDAKGFDRIVYEEELRDTELWLVRREDGATRKVAVPGSVYDIAWAPDDETLVFTAAPTPLIDDRYMARNLHAIHLPTNEVRTLADVPGKFGSFAISPDGSKVAYIAGRDANDPKESSLYVVPMRGGWSACLTPGDYEGHVSAVTWYDERTLLGLSVEGCETRLWMQAASGGEPATLLPRGAAAIGGMSYDRQSRTLAVIADRPSHPRELHALDLNAHGDEVRDAAHGKEAELPDAGHLRGDLVRVTDSNPGLGEFAFGKQEIFRYPARDGLEIEGLVIFPTDFDPKKRYPLICVIHGGPESQYLNGWVTRYATPGQMGAGRGYLQFLPNYRSSTGRGVAFSKAGQGDAAGAEFDDVLDGVDALIAKGWVDADRVGITGGSYGGYFTAWGATRHSARFRAGVMFVGISNQISKIGTTDIPQESYLSHWKVRPWERLDLYLERSPILYTDDAKTPLLILHGAEDPRVSPTQSKELHRWLKLRGQAPVRLILYPGEGHGNRRRASQLDYALRSLRWWDHFLKGDGEALPPAGISYERPN